MHPGLREALQHSGTTLGAILNSEITRTHTHTQENSGMTVEKGAPGTPPTWTTMAGPVWGN